MKKTTMAFLGIQHLLAMFGSTVLVPFLTGMNPSIALLTAGIGTLAFHLITGGKVPVFLGSSFAFIGIIIATLSEYGYPALKAGVIASGLAYALIALSVRLFGANKIKALFPPIVVGPMIIAIGLRLVPTAVSMAGLTNGLWDGKSAIVALTVVAIIFLFSFVQHSFFRMTPILFAMAGGYLMAFALGMVNLAPISTASWFGFSNGGWETILTLPEWNVGVMITFALVSFVVSMEHIGDITTNGAIVGKDFMKDPGLARTFLGDGVATMLAGFIGGPANTTYGENTGVLAITKVYDPRILRIAAVYAIVLAFFGKFGGFLQSIPTPVMGGISLILFGLISASGIRVLLSSKLDFSHSRNLLLCSLVLSLALGINEIVLTESVTISGLAVAGLVGVVLNLLLPQIPEEKE